MTTGTDDKKIHKSDIAANIGCVGLLVLVVAWGMVIYNGVHHGLNRQTINFRAEVTYQDGIVTLTNKEGYDWRDVWFSLDADANPETYEYSYYLSEIDAHTTYTIDLAKFTKNNLYYYDPGQAAPRHLSLFTQTTNGEGHLLYTWP